MLKKNQQSFKMCHLSALLTTRFWMLMKSRKAQGTTEYAILVGVLVVIAIIAVVAFRAKITDLWSDISTNINQL